MKTLLIVALISLSTLESYASNQQNWGLLGGYNFPKGAAAKVQYNTSQNWSFDAQLSLGLYWTTQQITGAYFFDRDEWSFFIGLGLQNWNFISVSFASSTPFSIGAGGGQAFAATVPLGLQFVDDSSGFSLEISVAADLFFTTLPGRVIPEGQILIGKFF